MVAQTPAGSRKIPGREAGSKCHILELPHFHGIMDLRRHTGCAARSMTFQKARPLVLLAEDDTDMRELIAARLAKEGMRVVELADGFALREYLELCRVGGEVPQPDVVVTDVRMPKETGPHALAQGMGQAPFVVITSCLDSETRSSAEQAGASAVFEKPFALKDLVVAIRRATHS